jgi:hypothetical protein
MLARNPLPVMVGCVIMMVCAVVLAVNDDRLVDWGGPLSKMVASHSMVHTSRRNYTVTGGGDASSFCRLRSERSSAQRIVGFFVGQSFTAASREQVCPLSRVPFPEIGKSSHNRLVQAERQATQANVA